MKKILIIICLFVLTFSIYAYARSRCVTTGTTTTTSNGRTRTSGIPNQDPWLDEETADFNLGGFTIINTGYSEGSVLFADSSGDITEDNTNFYWDDTNDYLKTILWLNGDLQGQSLYDINGVVDINFSGTFTNGTASLSSGTLSSLSSLGVGTFSLSSNIIGNSTSINLKPNSDATDYFRLKTLSNIPELTTLGGGGLKITTDGGDITLDPVGESIWLGSGGRYRLNTEGNAVFNAEILLDSGSANWHSITVDDNDIIFLNTIQDKDFVFQNYTGSIVEIFRIDTSANAVTWNGGGSVNANTAYTHVSNNGSDHSYIDQDVTLTSDPNFETLELTASGAAGLLTLDGTGSKEFRRGGNIAWVVNGSGTIGGYTYTNSNNQFVWDNNSQGSQLDTGVAYLDFDDGTFYVPTLDIATIIVDTLRLESGTATDAELEWDGSSHFQFTGNGTVDGGLGIAVPIQAGGSLYYGYGGTEDHLFGQNGTETIIYDDGRAEITANLTVGTINFAADAQSDDDYVITLSPARASYATGMVITFTANTANTGACTVNVNNLGAKALKAFHDQDPPDNYIEAGSVVVAVYDATNFQMIQPDANP